MPASLAPGETKGGAKRMLHVAPNITRAARTRTGPVRMGKSSAGHVYLAVRAAAPVLARLEKMAKEKALSMNPALHARGHSV